MRHLISTLQNHNQQMKGEVVKFKLRLRETQTELTLVSGDGVALCSTPSPSPSPGNTHRSVLPQVRAAKGSGMLQSQSSTELDVKEETVSPPATVASGDAAVKAESDSGSATPSSTGENLKLISHLIVL